MITLYSYYRSSCSYRVRIALNLKGLDYDIVPVHLVKDGGEQFSKNFSGINKAHRVPVLEHMGNHIAQSVAIIDYLEENFPMPSLYPKVPADKAKAKQLCQIINSDIQPLQNLSVLKCLVNKYGFTEEQKTSWIQHWMHLGFQSFEELVKQTSGQFSMGDQPGVADCFLVPQVYNAIRWKLDLNPFPTISAIADRCLELEPFQMAHPDNQPDTP